MMGRLKSDQGQLFYEFRLGDAVPEDHLVRKIGAALDLSWLRSELAPHYSSMGRPSIDPELMIRMLVVGYVFAIRSERLICREVQVNLAAGSAGSVSKTLSRIIRPSRAVRTMALRWVLARRLSVSSRRALRPVWLVAKALVVDASLVRRRQRERSIAWSGRRRERDPARSSRAVKEYLATLDDTAWGAASDVVPKFVSPSDPAAQWTGAHKGPAFFAYLRPWHKADLTTVGLNVRGQADIDVP